MTKTAVLRRLFIFFCWFNIFNNILLFPAEEGDLFDEIWLKINENSMQKNKSAKVFSRIKVEPFDKQLNNSEWQQKNAQIKAEVKDEPSFPLEICNQMQSLHGVKKEYDQNEHENKSNLVKIKNEIKIEEQIKKEEKDSPPVLKRPRTNDSAQMPELKRLRNEIDQNDTESSGGENDSDETEEKSEESDDSIISEYELSTDDASNQSERNQNYEENGGKCFRKKFKQNANSRDNFLTDEQKIEITKKFLAMKKKLSECENKRSYEEICQEIEEKFGINRRNIYEWRKQFGFKLKPEMKEKIAILKRYKQLKSEKKNLNEISKELQISQTSLARWRKEFKLEFAKKGSAICDEVKLKIIKKFDKIEKKMSRPASHRDKEAIGKKLGTTLKTIYRWKRQLGQEIVNHAKKEEMLNVRHSEELTILKRFDELKNANPKMTIKQIANKLKISKTNLYRCRKKFKVGTERKLIDDAEKCKIVENFDKIMSKRAQYNKEVGKEIARKLGFSIRAIYNWKKKFGGKVKNNDQSLMSADEENDEAKEELADTLPPFLSSADKWKWNSYTKKRNKKLKNEK